MRWFSVLAAAICAASCASSPTISANAPLSCAALPGASDVFAQRQERYLIFGEMHGTQEAPRAFAELVCEAAKSGPVVIGIERTPDFTAGMQMYLESDGGADAEAALLRKYFDGSNWGLSSEAFLPLFRRLRELRAAGASLQIIGFDRDPLASEVGQIPAERRMAGELISAAALYPHARIIVLVGNLHARRTPMSVSIERDVQWMAMHLPQAELLTFDLRYGPGELYNGGVERTRGFPAVAPPRLELSPSDGYDGIWAIGPVTVARPISGRAQRATSTAIGNAATFQSNGPN